MQTNRLILYILLATLTLAGCRTQPASESFTLNVFAAASLTEPFSEIAKLFESTHPGTEVVFNFAGSQQLAQQIIEGAPADVFASANTKQMDGVIDAGWIEDGSQQTFATNSLVVVLPQDNPAGLEELADLAQPGLKLVFAAKEVPVGQYSLDFLDKASADPGFGAAYRDDVLGNVVSYEDNVKAVLTKVVLGEADAGIVYASDVSGENATNVIRLEIPRGFERNSHLPNRSSHREPEPRPGAGIHRAGDFGRRPVHPGEISFHPSIQIARRQRFRQNPEKICPNGAGLKMPGGLRLYRCSCCSFSQSSCCLPGSRHASSWQASDRKKCARRLASACEPPSPAWA